MSKIVVVDDSYAELQMIEGYLKAANHTVVSFHEVIAPHSDITSWATGNPLALTAGRVNHFSFDFAFQEFDIICHEQGIDCKRRARLPLAPEAMTAMHYQRVRR